MTTLAAIVKAAQRGLEDQTPADWSDPDSLTDEQLEAIAGPGCTDVVTWDEQSMLPSSVSRLALLTQLIEARAWATSP
jgi:hypothetical protein